MRNKEAKMLDRTNETPVNGTENEIMRVNFLVRAGGLRRKIEKTFGMKEKRCTFGLLNQNCIIMKSEEKELEAVEGSQKDYKGVFYYGYCSFFLPCRIFSVVFHASPKDVSKSGKDGGMS